MNNQVDITIIIPCRERPNFLAIALDGLLKYSYHRLHTIIVNSTPTTFDPVHTPPDYYFNSKTGERVQKYRRVADFCDANFELMNKLDVTLVDVTEKVARFRSKYEDGLVFEGKTEYMDGVDIAYKDNLGLDYVKTPWVVPNWDDDFYPYQDWDKHLIDVANNFPDKSVFIPRHVQPFLQSQIDSMEANNQHMFYGQPWFLMPRDTYVTEDEWVAYCEEHSKDEVVVESCGDRINCHYLPMLYRTDDILKTIGPFSYKGGGYEAEMDDRCRDFGFQKVSSHQSFILHKGYVSRIGDDL